MSKSSCAWAAMQEDSEVATDFVFNFFFLSIAGFMHSHPNSFYNILTGWSQANNI